MPTLSDYYDFMAQEGRPLEEINPGSKEYALTPEEALQALEHLQGTNTPVLGGDILTTTNDKLDYAYHVWGDKYVYLDWAMSRNDDDESPEAYASRSHQKAREAIKQAAATSSELNQECFVVLVV